MFELSAQWAGFENIISLDFEKNCCDILRQHFDHKIYHLDINEYQPTKHEIDTIDIVCAGFPCQPYSNAGQRLGEKDDRDILPQVIEKVEIIQPRWVVLENVIGFANFYNGNSLRCLRDKMANIGYDTTVFDLPAAAFGLQSVERHLWIIAKADEIRCKGSEAHANSKHREKGQLSGANTGPGERRNLSESNFFRVGERCTTKLDKEGKVRLEQVGNAFPPQMSYYIFETIKRID